MEKKIYRERERPFCLKNASDRSRLTFTGHSTKLHTDNINVMETQKAIIKNAYNRYNGIMHIGLKVT